MASPAQSDAIHGTVPAACAAAHSAWTALRDVDDHRRARALETVALRLDHERASIIALAAEETALTPAELAPEFDRMTGTLKLFATVIRKDAWRRPAGTPPDQYAAPAPIGPPHTLQSHLIPLGPIAVFGASNFPLAYGVIGGDSASALAAGCPVVVKEHPAHPRIGRLLAATVAETLTAAGLTNALIYVQNIDPADHAVGASLVTHPAITAVGFTGSTPAGLALERLARERPDPIPVFAEMGSVNPILIAPAALSTRRTAIADLLAQSILLRFGQQCTCPGLIFIVPGPGSSEFKSTLAAAFSATPARDMLAPWIRQAYESRLREVQSIRGITTLARGQAPAPNSTRASTATLLSASLDTVIQNSTLRDEIFGPAAILIELPKWDDIHRVPLPGSLTLTIHVSERDDADLALARAALRTHAHTAGRIVINGVPTGVRVAESMIHSGPLPACNRPDSTAVGPRAIERWCRPQCWQNAPPSLLP